jgi:hypothetical protein
VYGMWTRTPLIRVDQAKNKNLLLLALHLYPFLLVRSWAMNDSDNLGWYTHIVFTHSECEIEGWR